VRAGRHSDSGEPVRRGFATIVDVLVASGPNRSETPILAPLFCLAVAIVITLSGCNDETSSPPPTTTPACPNDLPDACPSTPPTWDTGVSSLVESKCASCHTSGGQAAFRPFETQSEIQASQSSALNQVYACKMPPSAGVALTADERSTLLTWFVCGSP
jgi:hypothetical protein